MRTLPLARQAEALRLRLLDALQERVVTAGAHEPDHSRLLVQLDPRARRRRLGRLDAIVVPTARPVAVTAATLRRAARLAIDQDAVLVVLCSFGCRPRDLPQDLVDDERLVLLVLDLDADVTARLLPVFGTSSHSLARDDVWDTPDKRNVALVLAATFGWRYLLFLDDDMVDRGAEDALGSDDIAGLVDIMERDPSIRLVGWTVTDFPDNSVVCHTRRLVGLPQGVFVGAGAFLLRFGSDVPFFPRIYNEDWIFAYGIMRHSSPQDCRVGVAGSLGQRPYLPFARSRAMVEEVGDVIGEGLYSLVGRGSNSERKVLDVGYWESVIASRRRMIRSLQLEVLRRRRLEGPYVEGGGADTRRRVRRAALDAVMGAEEAHDRWESPGELATGIVGYFQTLLEDLRRWRKRLRRPPRSTVHGILADPTVCLVNAAAKHRLRPPSDLVISVSGPEEPRT